MQNSSKGPEQLLTEAYSLFEKKDFYNSLQILNQAEDLYNGELSNEQNYEFAASFFNLKGFIYIGLNSLNEAKSSFEKALNINQKSSQACAGLAEIFALNGENQKAKKMYEWALVSRPDNVFASSGLEKVNSLLNLSLNDNSLKDDKTNEDKVIEKVSENLVELLSKIYEIYNSKEYNLALEILDKNEKLFYSQYNENGNNDIISAYENLKGLIYLSIQYNEKAKFCFEKALKLNPQSSQACSGLGEVLYLSGEDENAKIMYEWGVKNDPKNQFALAGLEKVENAINSNPTSSSEIIDDTQKIEEVLKEILSSVEEMYELEYYSEAIKSLMNTEYVFNSYFKLSSDSEILSNYNTLKGKILFKLNRIEESQKSYETSLELNQTSSEACAGLGEIFILNGENKKAKTMYEYAVINDKDNQENLNKLSMVNHQLGYNFNHNTLTLSNNITN